MLAIPRARKRSPRSQRSKIVCWVSLYHYWVLHCSTVELSSKISLFRRTSPVVTNTGYFRGGCDNQCLKCNKLSTQLWQLNRACWMPQPHGGGCNNWYAVVSIVVSTPSVVTFRQSVVTCRPSVVTFIPSVVTFRRSTVRVDIRGQWITTIKSISCHNCTLSCHIHISVVTFIQSVVTSMSERVSVANELRQSVSWLWQFCPWMWQSDLWLWLLRPQMWYLQYPQVLDVTTTIVVVASALLIVTIESFTVVTFIMWWWWTKPNYGYKCHIRV